MGKTMIVPHDVRDRIEKIIAEGVRKAEAHYHKMIKTPAIRYDVTGTVAGRAHHAAHEWYINLNSVLLMENLESFSKRTPIHELAHMICAVVYPETLARRGKKMTSTGRMRREKREVHGPRFYEVCDVLGMDEASRCHGYDVTNAKKNVDTTIHIYMCLACNADIKVTAKRHTMIQNGTRKYTHTCEHRGKIVPKANVKLQMIGNQPIVHVQAPKPKNEGKEGPIEGKIGICWRYFKSYRVQWTRQQMIAVFINEADCTPAGASTYYAQCQKLFREGYI